MPQWLMDLAPFTHVPRMPVEAFAWPPTIALTAVAAGLCIVGVLGFRRRDIG
jgi:ABC-2 type transport system permease protein